MNQVRITSGIYKGRKIETPGGKTHPMGERERLALFNMIASYVPGATVLDAFSGSGALGIEALSRGASRVVFVEKNRKAESVIFNNLFELGYFPLYGQKMSRKEAEKIIHAGDMVADEKAGKAESICADVSKFETGERFDVILADPPYDAFDVEAVKYLVGFLKNDGIFVLSHPDKAPDLAGLSLEKTSSYAGANISIYSRKK